MWHSIRQRLQVDYKRSHAISIHLQWLTLNFDGNHIEVSMEFTIMSRNIDISQWKSVANSDSDIDAHHPRHKFKNATRWDLEINAFAFMDIDWTCETGVSRGCA